MTRTRTLAVLLLLVLLQGPAAAQWIVYDPWTVAKTVELIDRVYEQLELQRKQLSRWEEINTPLGDMTAYRLPPIRIGSYDLSTVGAAALPLLQGLNGAGDPRGERWLATVRPVPPAAYTLLASLPNGPERTALEKMIAATEIADSLAQRSVHQVGLTRTFTGELAKRVQTLTDDVTSTRRGHHYGTAVLDKLSGAAIIEQDQALVSGQLLSHLLELQVDDLKATRETDAQALDLRIQELLYGEQAAAALLKGAGDTIRNWSTR